MASRRIRRLSAVCMRGLGKGKESVYGRADRERAAGRYRGIHGRWDASADESYTARLLQGPEDKVLKKVTEEATEVALACKDRDHDHIRYEAADLVYHLLVCLERYGVTVEELAGELDARHR